MKLLDLQLLSNSSSGNKRGFGHTGRLNSVKWAKPNF